MLWTEFLQKARKGRNPPPGLLLCLDPGETTGWALFIDGEFLDCGQDRFAHQDLFRFIQLQTERVKPGIPVTIVAENYRVYGHKTEQHAGSEVVTIQYLGVIKLYCSMMGTKLVLQMAYQAKAFQSDPKLKEWGLYQTAKKHANDAIRHGCYYYLFHTAK